MSDRDTPPLVYPPPPHRKNQSSKSLSPPHQFNPNAGHFTPSTALHVQGNGTMLPMKGGQHDEKVASSRSHDPSHLEAMVDKLEHEHVSLRINVEELKTKCNDLSSSLELMKRGGWSVNIGPFKQQPKGAAHFKQELDELSREIRGDDNTDNEKVYAPMSKSNGPFDGSCPPHSGALNGTGNGIKSASSVKSVGSSGTDANNPLVTDGNVDITPFRNQTGELTPAASSPNSTIKDDTDLPTMEEFKFNKEWQPHYLSTLQLLSKSILNKIPNKGDTMTFDPDFLRNIFGGHIWSPGLNFILPGPGPCILPNRTYYTLDAEFEPYLPKMPGYHGAKLTAFFNKNPEEEYDIVEDGSSFENVPLFVLLPDPHFANKKRYVYFGHYSQTRWSDKLDYDRMVQNVPHNVKEYWAAELSAVGRPDWVTEALMKHFFPKPEYDGRMFGAEADGSITSEEEGRLEERVFKDVRKYVQALRSWESEARMKTSMIKKEFIMQAFERADADDPPALRLWWEYLECVDWRKDFHDMLVALQSRHAHYLK